MKNKILYNKIKKNEGINQVVSLLENLKLDININTNIIIVFLFFNLFYFMGNIDKCLPTTIYYLSALIPSNISFHLLLGLHIAPENSL